MAYPSIDFFTRKNNNYEQVHGRFNVEYYSNGNHHGMLEIDLRTNIYSPCKIFIPFVFYNSIISDFVDIKYTMDLIELEVFNKYIEPIDESNFDHSLYEDDEVVLELVRLYFKDANMFDILDLM